MTGPRIILGAGCAGLSLAVALIDAGVQDDIVVLDRRRSFPDDRTWCFWDTDGRNPFSRAATHSWDRWRIAGAGRDVVHHAPRGRYHHLPAPAFRAAAMERLASAPNVELRLGQRVDAVRVTERGVAVDTARGTIHGRHAYDAMAGSTPLTRDQRSRGPRLVQSFIGLEVTTDRPIFDPSTPTLMDFGVEQPGDVLNFMYVLPFAPNRALLEHTTLGAHGIPPAARKAAIDRYLAARGARITEVHREERGRLPMSVTRPVAGLSTPIGEAGGATRGSSGYAFTRIQRQVQAIAAQAAAGRDGAVAAAPPWLDLMDEIFLRVLDAQPASFAEWFPRLAAGMGGQNFARFMSDGARPDDAALAVLALPKLPFMRGAAEAMLDRVPLAHHETAVSTA